MGTVLGDDGAGNRVGVAPGAKWIGCRNMDMDEGTPATYAECFQWFLAPTDLAGHNPDPSKAPDVINNSWICLISEGCPDPSSLKPAVHNLYAAGIIIVAAAGNGDGCEWIYAPPAVYPESITVGATDVDDNIYSWSSRGPVTWDGSGRRKPDVCAPGAPIRSSFTNSSYREWGGTSMAAPHVTGLVALLLSAHPELRGQPDPVARLIEQTAIPRTTNEVCGGLSATNVPNNTYGWGRIDALAALALDDTDGDGIPDWWMLAYFGHRAGQASDHSLAHDDADGDGVSNYDEFIAGTDPTNPVSCFRVMPVLSGAQCVLMFRSCTNRLYTLNSRTNLNSGSWSQVQGQADVPGTGTMVSLSDSTASATARFYRVQVRLK